MNSLEAYSTKNPYGIDDTCAKFTIDDVNSRYVMADTLFVGQRYTLSMWIKSELESNVVVAGETITTNNEWGRHIVTFVADENDLHVEFKEDDIYYIYHLQVEIGNKATDWTPAPEDTSDDINTLFAGISSAEDTIRTVHESVSELLVKSDEIQANVSEMTTAIDNATGRISSTEEELASMKLASDQFDIRLQNISSNGVTKVVTETGFTFDRSGMTVDSSDSPTKTQVTPDGMTVYTKNAGGTQSEVLEATSDGVDATNLHAKTYLIIGGRSRFENYGSNRTGCFWIGG